ncbi:glycosyl transferase family 1, partial [Vibrio parahaemolyticus]
EHIGAGIDVVKGYLQEAKAHIFESWHSNIPLDIAFATIAHSAKYVSELPSATHKCYLVQDFEAMFNPVGDGYHIAE